MKYRKKPVVVECILLENNKESIVNALEFTLCVRNVTTDGLIIETLEGNIVKIEPSVKVRLTLFD